MSFPMVALGEVLIERKEEPSAYDLETGKIRIVAKVRFNDGQIQLRENGQTKTDMILIRPGDLVVSGINASKGAIAVYGEENNDSIAATIHYGAYIPNKVRVEVKFLWWLLRSRTFRDILLEYVPGGIKTELKAKRLLPIPIPLPPLPEQKRIVACIEELNAIILSAKKLRFEAIEESEVLLISVINQVVHDTLIMGHLSDVLLQKPKNGWSPRCDNIENGVPVLTLGAIINFQYNEKEFKRTSEPTSPDAHYWLRSGDLLISRSNSIELVGHAAIYNGKPSPCIYPDLMMRLMIDLTRADKEFTQRWLKSVVARDHILPDLLKALVQL